MIFIIPKKKNWRNDKKYTDAKKLAFIICKKACGWCGKKEDKLDIHHIKSYKNHPELKYSASNIICLCESCHYKTLKKEKKFEKVLSKCLDKLVADYFKLIYG